MPVVGVRRRRDGSTQPGNSACAAPGLGRDDPFTGALRSAIGTERSISAEPARSSKDRRAGRWIRRSTRSPATAGRGGTLPGVISTSAVNAEPRCSWRAVPLSPAHRRRRRRKPCWPGNRAIGLHRHRRSAHRLAPWMSASSFSARPGAISSPPPSTSSSLCCSPCCQRLQITLEPVASERASPAGSARGACRGRAGRGHPRR